MTLLTPIRTGLMAAGLLLAFSAAAQTQPRFSPQATEACVTQASAASPNLSGQAVLDCPGRAAQACMQTPGGDTTVGMITCLQGELSFWDTRLNAAYGKRMAAAKAEDAEMARIRAATTSLADTLKNMQRAWIAFRDASCLYEQAQWMGGTGGGPATLACHLHETARQTLRLEGWWAR